MTHICVIKLAIIGSNNGLSPGRHQAIIWTNAGILLIGTLGTKFSEILSEIHTFSFMKMRLKMSSAKWRPFCFGLNVLKYYLCATTGHMTLEGITGTTILVPYHGVIAMRLEIRYAWMKYTSIWSSNDRVIPDSKVHGANVGPTWSRHDPGGPHVGHMNFAIWDGDYMTGYQIVASEMNFGWHAGP